MSLDLRSHPIALAVTERITAELDGDHWGAAIEILGEALTANPDATADECWQLCRFAGQRQAHDDSSAIVPRATQYDRKKAGLDPIHCYSGLEFDPAETDKPTRQQHDAYIERHELESWANTDFEIDVAALAGQYDDAEIAARLGKSVKTITRTITTIAKQSGLPLYVGLVTTREHDSTARACIADSNQLFYVEFAGDWRIVPKESLTIDVGTLEPWCVQEGDGSEDAERRIWYRTDFDRQSQVYSSEVNAAQFGIETE